jgi:hypothetical protein
LASVGDGERRHVEGNGKVDKVAEVYAILHQHASKKTFDGRTAFFSPLCFDLFFFALLYEKKTAKRAKKYDEDQFNFQGINY